MYARVFKFITLMFRNVCHAVNLFYGRELRAMKVMKARAMKAMKARAMKAMKPMKARAGNIRENQESLSEH